MLIDAAVPGDRNMIKKEAEKILKSKDLITEIPCICNVEAKVIPVITVVTGTLSKSLIHYLSNTPGKHEIKELQKTIILGSAHILQTGIMY
jgi:MinD-like ATPase involved in chromosome partitioning or flagellar assembly